MHTFFAWVQHVWNHRGADPSRMTTFASAAHVPVANADAALENASILPLSSHCLWPSTERLILPMTN